MNGTEEDDESRGAIPEIEKTMDHDSRFEDTTYDTDQLRLLYNLNPVAKIW